MRSSTLTLLLFFLFASTYSDAQNKYEYLLNKSYAEFAPLFDTTVRLRNLPPEEFDKEIKKIIKLANEHGDDQLWLQARFYENQYKSSRKLQSVYDSYKEIEILQKEAIARKHKYYEIFIGFKLVEMIFHFNQDYEKAYTLAIKYYDKIKDIPMSEMPTKKSILLRTGHIYYHFGYYKEAKKYIIIADRITDNWRPVLNIRCKNTLGLIYRKQKNYDSAMHWFEDGLVLAIKHNSEIFIHVIKGNIGICHYLMEDYKRAIPFLKEDVDGSYKNHQYGNGIKSAVNLVDCYIKTGDVNKAEQELKNAWVHRDSMGRKDKHLSLLYNASALVSRAKGEYELAHFYRDSAIIFSDTALSNEKILVLAKVKQRINKELHDKEVEKLSVEKKLMAITRNGLIVVILLVCVISYLLVIRQRARNLLLRSRAKLVENKLASAKNELANFTKRLQEKNAIIEASTAEMMRLQQVNEQEEASKNKNEILQQLLDATILTDEEWVEFKRLFDQVHTGYTQRLREKYDNLSQADMRFIVLSKLKLTNKEMAAILGVQPDSIRTYKHRLRKKFDLNDDNSLTEIINDI